MRSRVCMSLVKRSSREREYFFPYSLRSYIKSEWSKVVKGGTKWRAKRSLDDLAERTSICSEGNMCIARLE